MPRSTFNKSPFFRYDAARAVSWAGWPDIVAQLKKTIGPPGTSKPLIVAVDCYQGVLEDAVFSELGHGLAPRLSIRTQDAFKDETEVRRMVRDDLTDDRVFGRLTRLDLNDYLDPARLETLRNRIWQAQGGVVLVVGPGASLISEPDLLVYADMARWEIQQRMRRNEVSNLGVRNEDDDVGLKYKWGYFVDWRVLDRHKRASMENWDYVLDANDADQPKMVDGRAYRSALEAATKRPLMLVPFFDPGPWGGQWMKEVCDLDRTQSNFAWCFNCVPEENSLLIHFDTVTIELPSINLVFRHPVELLGQGVFDRFGAEFPIRFDFLDTMEGGNLSLQVHPTAEYIRRQFGMPYTQDESYYLMDARPGARVYLGLREGVDTEEMRRDLERAENGGAPFDADRFAASYPVRKHDHVSIPAGTLHCSGKDAVVLEISATPYIFTFKLWDWGRLGLDGRPRPIHIEHGMNVLDSRRDGSWVRENLLTNVTPIREGEGWREERTGLHEKEFIETRRHWFTGRVLLDTQDTVHVLNLVQGGEVTVESPSGAFEPFVVHYAETFVIPAAVGAYTIRPSGPSEGSECAMIRAFVRGTSQEGAPRTN